jgi:hypothetical protein
MSASERAEMRADTAVNVRGAQFAQGIGATLIVLGAAGWDELDVRFPADTSFPLLAHSGRIPTSETGEAAARARLVHAKGVATEANL